MLLRLPRPGAVLSCLLVVCLGCPREPAPQLEHELLQCGMNVGAIHAGAVCELPWQRQWLDQRVVRVAIQEPEGPWEPVIDGGYLDSTGTLPAAGRSQRRRILQIRVPPESSRLIIRAVVPGQDARVATIPIAPYEASRALEQGIESWMAGNRLQAEPQLREAMNQGGAATRSRARRQLAKFLLEEDGEKSGRLTEVLRLYAEAAQLARESGEVFDEAFSILNEATLQQQYLRQSAAAEQLLDSPRMRQLAAELPGLGPWIALYQGAVFASADPYRALMAVEKGMASAELYQDDRAGEQLCRQRAVLLHTLGRVAEAKKRCSAGRTVNSCWDAHNLLVQARIQLTEMEVTHQRGIDPRPDLQKVIDLLESDCPASNAKRSEARIYQAHAKFLAGDYEQLSEEEMAKWPSPQDPELYAELLDLRGQLALVNEAPGSRRAEEIFQKLRAFAQPRGLHVYVWRSLIGLARSREQSDPEQALLRYQEALRLLEEWAEQLPLGLGHGSFLGRYEEGTRRYVDFLLRQKRFQQALEVVRRVRVLGFLALMLTRQVEDLPESKRASLLTARVRFEQARMNGDLPTMAQMRGKLLDQLSEILGIPRVFPLPAFPPILEGEALFACFPVFPEQRRDAPDSDWACFATRDTGAPPTVARVGSIDPERMDGRQLSEKLLGPFMAVLAPARVIRVLDYGRFAQIPMHLLPLLGSAYREERPLQRLGDRRTVVYALDLPAGLLPATSGMKDRSDSHGPPVLIVDPHKEHNELRRCVTLLDQVVASRFGPPRVFRAEMPVPALLDELGRAPFFHFAGHVGLDYGGCAYSLALSETESISAGMLLRLRHAPDRAVLIGCGTGSTQDEYGDGVTLGVAQALLVRGAAEVLGTSRTVLAKTAAAVECHLYRHLLPQNSPYPLAAALQRTLSEPAVEALGAYEQGAFRSYVY